jgi:arginine exporter protein ArgO
MLCCSVLVGAGMQGLASAGFADKRWVLAAAAIMCTLAIVTLLLATKYFQTFLGMGAGYAKLFTEAGKMYVLGAIVAAIIFFMIRAKLRMRQLRQVALCAAMAVDIFLGARFIVDKIL